jgi:hypothetical protein
MSDMAKKRVSKADPLARTGYILSDVALAGLARNYAAGVDSVRGIRGSYLRILLAHTQRELEKAGVKRPTEEAVLEAVNTVHDHQYGVIAGAVITPEIADAEGLTIDQRKWRASERNRKLNFARSAKSTLVRAVKAGLKVMGQNPAEVTKESLRKTWASPATDEPVTIEQKITRTETRLEELVKELAAEDNDAAQRVVAQLHAKLAGLVPLKPTIPSGRRRRVGEIVMHSH